ncbi:hypothetical protein G7B40_010975 [Aetokthonos hydrillicola Thurmond2011]|jgi:hypothetical protein|uniref:Uncharacterized protein n=1 Tax=Aetokthonos hydrillicola Thurmond2011 TaxID=2712845 RepID=A0AAP5M7G6_9CYAN|nr:hypothetical protein [Aetokthonos hydrillicola]MBO3459814.1 hypothetical protein [Aetokthonos hydrillicola CCALA 1050]MBW4584541.1 hypothetical protein [Aetokthonos hydrillicola CCALA 1050]MDR9895085.1 hypothetical protein [Aetokthonos hydrillicola Thurmond2011]
MGKSASTPDSFWEYHKCFQRCHQAKTKLEETLATIAEYDEANPEADEIISRLLEEAALIALNARPQQWDFNSEPIDIEAFEPIELEEDDFIDYHQLQT